MNVRWQNLTKCNSHHSTILHGLQLNQCKVSPYSFIPQLPLWNVNTVSRNMHQKIKSVGNTRMACLYVIDSISWGKLTAWLRRISTSKRRLDTVKSGLGSLYKWKPSHQESNCEESRSASNNSPGSLRDRGALFHWFYDNGEGWWKLQWISMYWQWSLQCIWSDDATRCYCSTLIKLFILIPDKLHD